MSKISVAQFKHNTLSMLNLVEQAENTFPEGPERDKAYALIGTELLGDPMAFDGLV